MNQEFATGTFDAAPAINALVALCHDAAEQAGWWIDPPSGLNLKRVINGPEGPLEKRFAKALVAEKLMLKVSELAEAMEGHRKGLMDDKLPHRTMLEVEFADCIIRICDTAGAMGLDLGGAIVEKMAFNAVRPDHKLEARMAEGGKAY